MNLIVDCSYIMSCLLPDEDKNIEPITAYNLYVPTLFYLECNNVLINSMKRNRITKIEYQQYLNMIQKLPVNIDKFSSLPESLSYISKLSLLNNLSAYDASYLELAIRINAKVATLDKALIKACELNNVELYFL